MWWEFLMPRNPKKDALVSAYRSKPPWRPDEPISVNVNLNVGGALTLKLEQPPPPSSQAGVWITATCDGFSAKGKDPMTYKLPNDKQISVKVEYLDAKGNPASVDGDVTWETSDDMIANVGVLQGDSTQAMVVPGQNIGQAQITATADADLGEGTKEVICTLDVEVVGGEAVIGTITPVGEPQPIDPTPAPQSRARK